MVSGLGWGLAALALLIPLLVVLAVLGKIIASFIAEVREASERGAAEVLLVLLGGAFVTLFTLILIYAGFGWSSGDSDPVGSAIDSTVGTILQVLIAGTLLVGLLATIMKIAHWAADNPSAARGRATTILIWALLAPFSFIILPVTGWRKSKADNEGALMQTWSASIAFFIGVMISAGAVAAYAGLISVIIS